MLYTLSDRSRTLWQTFLETVAHLWHPGDNKVKKALILFLCLSVCLLDQKCQFVNERFVLFLQQFQFFV